MKKKYLLILLVIPILLLIILNGGNKKHEIIKVKNGENVVINSQDIDGYATYFNYEIDENTIQLFVVKGTDNKIRTLINTCNACNPAENSFFVQENDHFIYQTCGNKFHVDEIGLTKAIGCSPIAILDEDKIDKDGKITISHEFIETYKSKFEKINIFKN